MKNFKRYRNRKLYDIEESTYVNLNTIANYVNSGISVTITNFDGQDITKNILALIVVSQVENMSIDQLINLVRLHSKKEDPFTWEHP